MRPVRGFERPAVQWLFVALGAALVVVAGAEGLALVRARNVTNTLRAADLSARVDRRQLEARAAREQAAREALSLELGRVRNGTSGTAAHEPTLTLPAITVRAATPPEPTVKAPAQTETIQLRLLLPADRAPADKRYAIAFRGWSGGTVLWSRGGLAASVVDKHAMVTARLTGDVLEPGAYEIVLTDVTTGTPAEVAFYHVSVGPRALSGRP
jgi:hypothetical protein